MRAWASFVGSKDFFPPPLFFYTTSVLVIIKPLAINSVPFALLARRTKLGDLRAVLIRIATYTSTIPHDPTKNLAIRVPLHLNQSTLITSTLKKKPARGGRPAIEKRIVPSMPPLNKGTLAFNPLLCLSSSPSKHIIGALMRRYINSRIFHLNPE